jgi:hypothetical protein
MTHSKDGKLPRRRLLQAGTALAAVPLVGFGAPQVMAQIA